MAQLAGLPHALPSEVFPLKFRHKTVNFVLFREITCCKFAYMQNLLYLCGAFYVRVLKMKKLYLLIAVALMSLTMQAGENDLLWDYTSAAPTANPDRGLVYENAVNDAEGVKNELKGIKLNSSGFCYFTKAPVAGMLKLTFGPRSGLNRASLQVHTWSGGQPREETRIGVTCEIRRSGTQYIPLTAEQNNIYITRLLEMEAVLQRIEFVEGETYVSTPCDEAKGEEEALIREVNIDSLSENARFFLRALADANKTGNTTIYLPNGLYDLGELTLTAIEANNISIIGESMEGTIIRNAPDYQLESIAKTATLRIANDVEGTYLQNLTLENALDYYKNNNGRAVALWDQGTKTICKNVRLLSHQDTYYSDMVGAFKYFEDCEIHGTVDFICGDGTVYFKNTLLYCERRGSNGGGVDIITANRAFGTDRGYIFDGCTIKSECPVVSFGRAWNNTPKCVFLNTVFDYSAGEFAVTDKKIQRWNTEGMRVLPELFGEYKTKDVEDRVISPQVNNVTFTFRGTSKTMNTILSSKQAKAYSLKAVFGPWANEIKKAIKTNQNYKQ